MTENKKKKFRHATYVSQSGRDPKPVPADLHNYRKRMLCAGRIVRNTVGRVDPSMVTQDAYLQVVSRMIEILASPRKGENAIPTEELIALSKAIAEQRRLDIAKMEVERKYPDSDDRPNARAASGSGSRRFDSVLKDVYGTNLTSRGSERKPANIKKGEKR